MKAVYHVAALTPTSAGFMQMLLALLFSLAGGISLFLATQRSLRDIAISYAGFCLTIATWLFARSPIAQSIIANDLAMRCLELTAFYLMPVFLSAFFWRLFQNIPFQLLKRIFQYFLCLKLVAVVIFFWHGPGLPLLLLVYQVSLLIAIVLWMVAAVWLWSRQKTARVVLVGAFFMGAAASCDLLTQVGLVSIPIQLVYVGLFLFLLSISATVLLRLQQSLRERERAVHENRAKSEIMARLNHELRTPLSAIIGLGRMLQKTGPTIEQAKLLNDQALHAEHLQKLVEQMLQQSRIENRVNLPRLQQFQLSEILGYLDRLYSNRALNKSLAFKIINKAGTHWFKSDSMRIKQILMNLLDNALKFTQRGRIELKVILQENPCYLDFIVSDTGEGIDFDHHKAIFSPFQQAPARGGNVAGLGLGLSIAYSLAHSLHGQISLESMKNKGAEFTLRVPVEVVEGTAAGNTVDLPSAACPPISILVAEDDAVNSLYLATLLEEQGHRVTTVRDGNKVIEKLTTDSFDLILMDISMGTMSGIDTARYIRQHLSNELCRTPIIAVTAHTYPAEIAQYKAAGMNAFIGKPINEAELLDKIRELVVSESTKTWQGQPISD